MSKKEGAHTEYKESMCKQDTRDSQPDVGHVS